MMEQPLIKENPIIPDGVSVSTYGLDLLNCIKDPVGLYSNDFRLLWLNTAMMKYIQISFEDAIGTICYETLLNKSKPCGECPVKSVLASCKAHVMEKKIDEKGGEGPKWFEVHAYPVCDNFNDVNSVITYSIGITGKRIKQHKKNENQQVIANSTDKTVSNNRISLGGGDIQINVYLSNRETEILRLIPEGYTNKQISEFLSISPNTVKSHVTSIFNKMGVNDRTQAAVLATRHRLV